MSEGQTPDWDIDDDVVPRVAAFDTIGKWCDGHVRRVYPPGCEAARKHASGWAMRNAGNHNGYILKKMCVGLLVCSQRCRLPDGSRLHLRPAICAMVRKKQQGKPCPNLLCSGGRLEVLRCRGNNGNPVPHFWRHTEHGIYFQAIGTHDHPKPLSIGTNELRSKGPPLGADRRVRDLNLVLAREAAIADKILTVKPDKQMPQKACNPHPQPPPLIPDNQRLQLTSTCGPSGWSCLQKATPPRPERPSTRRTPLLCPSDLPSSSNNTTTPFPFQARSTIGPLDLRGYATDTLRDLADGL